MGESDVCDLATVRKGDEVKFTYKNKEYLGEVLDFADDCE